MAKMMKDSESKSQDAKEALGLHTQEKFDSSKLGAQGNEKGNQRPACKTESMGGYKVKQ